MQRRNFVTICLTFVWTLSLLCSCSTKKNSEDNEIGPNVAPKIISISIFGSDGKQIVDEAGWIPLTESNTIQVNYSGVVTKAEFYTTPAGTETAEYKTLIGTVNVDETSASPVSFEWQLEDSFLGYISVVLYNGDLTSSSESDFLIKAYRED